MRNTTVPLSIAFITSDLRVLDIQDMEPLNETLLFAPDRYRYAVEANRGWFAENGVEVGAGFRIGKEPGYWLDFVWSAKYNALYNPRARGCEGE